MKAMTTKESEYTLSTGDIIKIQEVYLNDRFVCFQYQGFDIYEESYEEEGERFDFFVYNQETKEEIVTFNDIEECLTYIIDYNKI
jgi:hypothetical protein